MLLSNKVWLISVVLIAAMAVVFLWVAAGATQQSDAETGPTGSVQAGSGCSWRLS